MTTFRVEHRTTYRYARPVTFGEHRMMLRPRDGHDMRILDSALTLSPPAEVRWEFDTFGNSVAFAAFREPAEELVIDSALLLRRYALEEPVQALAPTAVPYPFRYSDEDAIDLTPYLHIQCEDDRQAVATWLATALPTLPDHSLALLEALSHAVHGGLTYRAREEPGVQTPGETLSTRSGTCRDYAFLFMEAARQLGIAARFVTGYLYDPALDADAKGDQAVTGAGATHAWAEVFVPGGGWIEFDPTNRIVAGSNLVRVATTRSPAQALPIQGSYQGGADAFLDMDVSVTLTETDPDREKL